MIDTQQHPTSSSTMKWEAQKTSARAVPSGVEQPLSPPQSSLPGHRRKRRNSLVVVTKHLNTSTKNNVCLASTRDNAYQSPSSPFSNLTAPWMKSCCSGTSFNNLMMSWMTLRCSGPTPAQPRRPAVSRHRALKSTAQPSCDGLV